MDEEGLIALMTKAAAGALPNGAVGPGDDAAVLPWTTGEDLVVTTDVVAEGVHYPAAAKPQDIGRFVVHVNLSDLAAMGATPRGFLLAYAAPPDTAPAWFEGVAAGSAAALRAHGCPLLGGDTKEAGTRVLTGTALGAVPRGRAVLRSGAREGDVVAVTGALGGPGAVLHAWQERRLGDSEASRGLLSAEARIAAGIALREGGAHALIAGR